jgi:DNA-binding transcriptional LysR family regulator
MEAVMSDELRLIVSKSHPLAERSSVTLEEVMEFPFVLREQGSGTRLVMEEQLRRKNIDPASMKIVMELGSTGAVKSAVEAGLGISFVSTSSVKHEVALDLIRTIKVSDSKFQRQFYSIYLKSAILPISAVTFLTFLRERDLQQWL